MEEDAAVFAAESACDDEGLMTEHLLSGNAVRGEVIASDPRRVVPGRVRPVVRPLVVVRLERDCATPPPGQEFWLSTHPRGKHWEVTDVRAHAPGLCDVTLALTTEGRTLDIPSKGERACFVSFSADRGPWMQLPQARPKAFGRK